MRPVALTLAEKASVRRHLGITAAGSASIGPSSGLRTVVRMEQIEAAFNDLDLAAEALLTGDPAASLLLFDPVHVGDTIALAVTLNATQTTVEASTAIVPTDSAVTVAQRLATALRPQLSGFAVAAYQPLEAGRGKLALRSLGSGTFSLSPSVLNPDTDGPTTFVFLEQNGDAYPSPSYEESDGNGIATNAVVVNGLLPVCDAIEAALLAASQNLSFGRVGSRSVGGANFEVSELVRRNALLAQYRRALGGVLFPA